MANTNYYSNFRFSFSPNQSNTVQKCISPAIKSRCFLRNILRKLPLPKWSIFCIVEAMLSVKNVKQQALTDSPGLF